MKHFIYHLTTKQSAIYLASIFTHTFFGSLLHVAEKYAWKWLAADVTANSCAEELRFLGLTVPTLRSETKRNEMERNEMITRSY